MEKRWIVKGLNCAFLCTTMDRVKAVCEEIIRKGGVPVVNELKEADHELQRGA